MKQKNMTSEGNVPFLTFFLFFVLSVVQLLFLFCLPVCFSFFALFPLFFVFHVFFVRSLFRCFFLLLSHLVLFVFWFWSVPFSSVFLELCFCFCFLQLFFLVFFGKTIRDSLSCFLKSIAMVQGTWVASVGNVVAGPWPNGIVKHGRFKPQHKLSFILEKVQHDPA